MTDYKITYIAENGKKVEIIFTAKDESEAIEFAKHYRNDPFNIEEMESENDR